MTTLSLVAQGTAVVTQGQRRWVDAQWFRGQSSLKIGWNWVKLALSKGYELITRWHIFPQADPVPAMASKLQHQKPPQRFFTLEVQGRVSRRGACLRIAMAADSRVVRARVRHRYGTRETPAAGPRRHVDRRTFRPPGLLARGLEDRSVTDLKEDVQAIGPFPHPL